MGKYIKRFNNVNAQTAFINSINDIEPHVSCVVGSSNLKYNAPFVAIEVANSAYIKSSELYKFLEEVIGVHVYSDTTCKTFAADGEYSVIINGINDYYESLSEGQELEEGEELEWGMPASTSFTVENGAVSLYIEGQEPIDIEIAMLGYLESDQSKKAYSGGAYGINANVYSDESLTTPAVSGHYISYIAEILSFDVSNGRITNIDWVPEEQEEEEPINHIELGHLSTDSSKKAYISVSDEDSVYESNPTIYAYSDEELETLAVNGNYVGDWGLVVSFNITNGLISDIEVNEAPAEEENVMPADDMDPDSGGGEDIVEEDPVPTDPPLPEEPEVIE